MIWIILMILMSAIAGVVEVAGGRRYAHTVVGKVADLRVFLNGSNASRIRAVMDSNAKVRHGASAASPLKLNIADIFVWLGT